MRFCHVLFFAVALSACGRSALIDDSSAGASSSGTSSSGSSSASSAATSTGSTSTSGAGGSGAGGAGAGGSGTGGCGAPEVCDGIDNDCDGSIDEGDPGGGQACATGLPGVCSAGVTMCVAGGLICAQTLPPDVESCNGVDDDCDGSVDEAGALGCLTYFKDADGDGWGLAADSQCLCAPSAPYSAKQTEDCNDASSSVHPGATEVCNGIDDDCNAIIDDGFILCGCTQATFGGHVYVFCPDHATWDEALATCQGVGLHLVSITSAAEDAFVNTTLNTISNEKWWMGLSDKATEGSFVWEDGSPVTYTNWEANEPNDAGGNEDCAQLNRFFPQDTWNDEACGNALSYVCESP